MWLLYQAAVAAGLVAASPALILGKGAHYRKTLGGRLGGAGDPPPAPPSGSLWIHAVSVGEVGVAATLARALPPELPLLLTTVTPTGQERAQELLRARRAAGTAAVAYLPFDLGFAVARFFRRYAPRALVLVEGDYWPLVLRDARRAGLPVAVVNGRVSSRSFARQRRLRPWLGPLFDPVGAFGMQTAEDRERLLALGVPAARVTVTGNLKFETPEPARLPELEGRVTALADGRPILVAGSTMDGEETAVLDAVARLGVRRPLVILAPRHPERWPAVAELLAARSESWARRSDPTAAGRPDVLLLDSLGELAAIYRLASAAFVGGTLAPKGGHNPLEPARFGVPVAVGPSMENFREIADRLDAAAAWARVGDAGELAAVLGRWLDEPATAREVGGRGRAVVEANRGALGRTLELLRPLLASVVRDPVER